MPDEKTNEQPQKRPAPTPHTADQSAETYSALEKSASLSVGDALADNYTTAAGTARERQVLMHTPMGIRIDWNITRSQLALWISPQATKTVDYRLRNFSNRDDHTSIFDRISLPGLVDEDFARCDYDPLHSVIRYGDQIAHLLALPNDPAVALWFERPETVDFKTDKQDTPLLRTDKLLTCRHPDRGLTFEFAAALGEGEGRFIHQPAIDAGRSTYARVRLSAEQVLIVAGELEWECPGRWAEALAAQDPGLLERRVEEGFEQSRTSAADPGAPRIELEDESWQQLHEKNRRVLFSAMDWGGAVPAAFRLVYYHIWHMDGAMTSCSVGQAGWPGYLRRWAKLQIANPTETDGPIPGRYFGQMVNGRISKQEEWGTYWAVWSAFTHWTQTGERTFQAPAYWSNLLGSLDWVEQMCWDEQRQAFGIWYRGEDPLKGSYDFGFDAAVGCPMNTSAPSLDGQAMVRRYNFDFNVMMYNTYLMLAAMAAGRDVSQCPDDYLPRARRLEPFLARCREEGTSSFSLLEDGSEARETNALRYPPGAFFPPDLADLPDLLRQEAKFDLSPIEQGEEMFAHQLLSTLVAEDPAVFGSENLERFCRVYVPQCLRAGTYLQMPGTLPEDVNCPDGSYHDNRPQLFATGLLELAWTGLALRRVPFGLAVRAGQRVRRIENYGYAGSTLDVTLKGEGPAVAAVRINGVDLPGSCQLPESWLTGQNHVEVVRGDRPDGPGRLTTSTVRLADVQDRGDGSLRYSLVAYGKNQLAFDGRIAAADLRDQSDKQVEFRLRQAGGWDYLDFEGTGEFALTIKPDA